jgi:hypothetical protein
MDIDHARLSTRVRSSFAALLVLVAFPAAAASLVANGSFEVLADNGPAGWHPMIGARTSDASVPSRWEVVGGGVERERCLRLSGDAGTSAWSALESDAAPVVAGTSLRLSARIRTQGVHAEGRQFQNSNVALRFESSTGGPVKVDGRPVVGTPLVTGDADWTRVERVVEVPAGASSARVLCFLSMSGTAWFDDVRLERVEEPAWIVTRTERFVFHELAGDRLTDAQRQQSEADLADLETRLGVRVEKPIRFFKYASNAEKARLTGNEGNAEIEGDDAIHSIWPTERHEIVHLVARRIGEPGSILFGEGLAVALAGPWQGSDPDDHVRRLAKEGRLPALATLVEPQSFKPVGDDVAYPVAGSFVRWLIMTQGLDTFKQAYPATGSGADAFRARVAAVYGQSLDALERAWHVALGVSP